MILKHTFRDLCPQRCILFKIIVIMYSLVHPCLNSCLLLLSSTHIQIFFLSSSLSLLTTGAHTSVDDNSEWRELRIPRVIYSRPNWGPVLMGRGFTWGYPPIPSLFPVTWQWSWILIVYWYVYITEVSKGVEVAVNHACYVCSCFGKKERALERVEKE